MTIFLLVVSLGACTDSHDGADDETTSTTVAAEGRVLSDFMLSMCLSGTDVDEAIDRAEQLADDGMLLAEQGGPPVTSLTPEIESAITNMVGGPSCG